MRREKDTRPPDFMIPGHNANLDRNLAELSLKSTTGDALFPNAPSVGVRPRAVPDVRVEEPAAVTEATAATATVVSPSPVVRRARATEGRQAAFVGVAVLVVLAAVGVAMLRRGGREQVPQAIAASTATAETAAAATMGTPPAQATPTCHPSCPPPVMSGAPAPSAPPVPVRSPVTVVARAQPAKRVEPAPEPPRIEAAPAPTPAPVVAPVPTSAPSAAHPKIIR